jgi:hypothetical protein
MLAWRWVLRRHNPEVAGSNPAPLPVEPQVRGLITDHGGQAFCIRVSASLASTAVNPPELRGTNSNERAESPGTRGTDDLAISPPNLRVGDLPGILRVPRQRRLDGRDDDRCTNGRWSGVRLVSMGSGPSTPRALTNRSGILSRCRLNASGIGNHGSVRCWLASRSRHGKKVEQVDPRRGERCEVAVSVQRVRWRHLAGVGGAMPGALRPAAPPAD